MRKNNEIMERQMPTLTPTRRYRSASIEPLEPRTLLSAGGTLDPSFGSGGLLTGEAPVSVRIDGTMVADPDAGDLAVLNPDGSFDAAFTPPVSRGPTSGKGLRLSGGSISRVNADGTPDTTFGNGGTVSDLTSGTTVTSFSPQALFSVGDQLLVAGSAQTASSGNNFIAIERLNADGSIDRTFGAQGIALSASGSSGSVNVAFIRTDVPTGNILIAGQLNGQPGVAKFGPAGQVLGQFFTATASDPHVYGLSVQNDEKTVLLIGADNKSFSLDRLNVDMSIDTSFGTNGVVAITAPDSPSTVTRAFPGSLNIRPDGLIIVGASFDYSDRAHASFTFAFSPGVPDGSASVSGDLYTDTGSTTTTTTAAISRAANNPNTVALPYWQVYADLNNNGHFDWGEPTAYADSNGHYNLDGLAPGKYHIREVQRPGFVSNTADPGSFDVTLSRGQQSNGHHFGNRHIALISGVVYLDTNANGVQDAGDQPLAGWKVFDDTNNDGVWEKNEPFTLSNDDGNYNLTLEGGKHHARVVLQSGYRRANAAGGYAYTIPNGQSATGQNFLFQSLQQITAATVGAAPTLTSDATPTQYKSVLTADHADLVTATSHQHQWLRELQSTLRSDTAAYKSMLRQLKAEQRAAKKDPSLASNVADLQSQLSDLKQTISDDKQAIVTFRTTDEAGVKAAKNKITADQHMYKLRRHK